MMKGNFKKAMSFLTKSKKIAEKELKPDHKWKAWIMIALATLHDKMGNLNPARDIMHEGLWMGKRLNLQLHELGKKDYIQDFIIRYGKIFPESEFPSKQQLLEL